MTCSLLYVVAAASVALVDSLAMVVVAAAAFFFFSWPQQQLERDLNPLQSPIYQSDTCLVEQQRAQQRPCHYKAARGEQTKERERHTDRQAGRQWS